MDQLIQKRAVVVYRPVLGKFHHIRPVDLGDGKGVAVADGSIQQRDAQLPGDVLGGVPDDPAGVLPGHEAGQQHPGGGHPGVALAPHLLQGAAKLHQPLEAEDIRLHRHQHPVGGGEGVDGEDAQGGRGIDEDVVVKVQHRLQTVPEQVLAALAGELQFDAAEQHVGGDDVAEGGVLDGLHRQQFPLEGVVDGVLHLHPVVRPQAEGKVPLGVEVDAEDPPPHMPQPHGDGIGGGGLAYPPLLVGNAKYLCPVDRKNPLCPRRVGGHSYKEYYTTRADIDKALGENGTAGRDIFLPFFPADSGRAL